MRDICNLSDCNGTCAHQHLVRKQTRNHLPICPNVWVFVNELSGYGFESRFPLKMGSFYTKKIVLWFLKETDSEEQSQTYMK